MTIYKHAILSYTDNVSYMRLNKEQARKLLSKIMSDDGHISFSRHAREELKNDKLTTVDAVNVLASTDSRITDEPEFKNDIWRYRVKTNKICVVISFIENPHGVLVITVFKMNRS